MTNYNKILKSDINEAGAKIIALRIDTMFRDDDQLDVTKVIADLAKVTGIPVADITAAVEDFNTLDRYYL